MNHTDDLIFANPPKIFAYMKPLLCSFGTAKKERFMVEAHEILDKQKSV